MVKVCFGGTFDPVHMGHIGSAIALSELLSVPVTMLPNGRPSHRSKPGASAQQRLDMLRLACADKPQLMVDSREIERLGPSYTFDSVKSIRAEMDAAEVLIWCLGADAFAQLHTWHKWRELLQYTHLLVLQRPGSLEPKEVDLLAFWQQHQVNQPQQLMASPKGAIATVRLPQFAVSATAIRQHFEQGTMPPEHMLPAEVAHYIMAQNLYNLETN